MFSDFDGSCGCQPCRQTLSNIFALQMVDVGCGIGGSSRHIARRLGCSARGITLSPVQVPTPMHTCEEVLQRLTQAADVAQRISLHGA